MSHSRVINSVIFIALVFMIANRASDDVTTEKDTIAQNVGRLVSVLSYVPDVVNVQVSQSLLKDARERGC